MPKRGASILLDMSMSWNVTIMYLLTPKANKQQQVDSLSPFSLFHLQHLSVMCHIFLLQAV